MPRLRTNEPHHNFRMEAQDSIFSIHNSPDPYFQLSVKHLHFLQATTIKPKSLSSLRSTAPPLSLFWHLTRCPKALPCLTWCLVTKIHVFNLLNAPYPYPSSPSRVTLIIHPSSGLPVQSTLHMPAITFWHTDFIVRLQLKTSYKYRKCSYLDMVKFKFLGMAYKTSHIHNLSLIYFPNPNLYCILQHL